MSPHPVLPKFRMGRSGDTVHTLGEVMDSLSAQSSLARYTQVRPCVSVQLGNGDSAYPGAFIVYNDPSSTSGAKVHSIGRIKDILADASGSKVLGCTVQQVTIGESVLPYRMRQLVLDGRYSFKSISVS